MKAPWSFRALAACFAVLWAACMNDKLAGGFDDAENPSIRVAFSDSAGKPAGAALINVYARYQNPFKDSLPILSLAGAETVSVRDTAVRSAFARALSRGTKSPSGDTLEFNLVATAPGGEAFLGGYALVRRATGWGFIRRDGGSIAYADARGVLASAARLPAPVLGQRGTIGPRGLELGLRRVFVPGSPYAADLAADGSFAFGRMAAGRYELKAVAADEKVYTAADTLATGAGYSASDWSEADVIWISP